ncbi:MAG: O-methyltransferase [bacterium]
MKVTLGLVGFAAALVALRLAAAPAPGKADEDPFRGIDDARLLPMLRHLPYEHGGLNVPAQDGRFLHDLIVRKGYMRGLEIGTSNGYSSLWLGLAFRETGGRLITIEIEPKRAKEARRNIREAGLADVIDSRIRAR